MKKVFLVCSGLGYVQRGYESFTQECFAALSVDPSLDITLLKGGGKTEHRSITLANFPRNARITAFLSNLTGQEPYFCEQASFFLSLLPHIYRQKPDVILFSDFSLGTMLWHWRRISKLSYKLLFSNGAPNGPPFSRMDYVQHLTPTHYQIALKAGEPASKHNLIPYGVEVGQNYSPLNSSERKVLREKLNLPPDRPLILSVAAINKTHKRMDYLIREVANLPEPRPYLLLLGQIDQESSEIIQLGQELLGTGHFQSKTVTSMEISDYYSVADLFVLASLNEGFGRVFLEAMGHGLPCLVHDYEVTRFILQDQGYFSDFSIPGALTTLVQNVLDQDNENAAYERHQAVYERFSWDKLKPTYIQMIHRCASSTD
jgi:1,2-diacylglycerol 3-alpha-glucosyltransferase